jgi:hypothetical protein
LQVSELLKVALCPRANGAARRVQCDAVHAVKLLKVPWDTNVCRTGAILEPETTWKVSLDRVCRSPTCVLLVVVSVVAAATAATACVLLCTCSPTTGCINDCCADSVTMCTQAVPGGSEASVGAHVRPGQLLDQAGTVRVAGATPATPTP